MFLNSNTEPVTTGPVCRKDFSEHKYDLVGKQDKVDYIVTPSYPVVLKCIALPRTHPREDPVRYETFPTQSFQRQLARARKRRLRTSVPPSQSCFSTEIPLGGKFTRILDESNDLWNTGTSSRILVKSSFVRPPFFFLFVAHRAPTRDCFFRSAA